MTTRLTSVFLLSAFLLCFVSCSNKKAAASSASSGYRDYLGEYAYDLPAACLVWEPVQGETDEKGNPVYGIQYREIKDLDKLLASTDTKFLIYFNSRSYGENNTSVTAVVEEIAEKLAGKLTVISLDGGEFNDLLGKYQVSMLPDFVLCGSGMEAKVFQPADTTSWSMQEVIDWLASNGYNINGGKNA